MASPNQFYENQLNGKQRTQHPDSVHGTINLDVGSLILDVEQHRIAIETLEKSTRMMSFTSVEDIGLDPATVTVEELRKKMPHNTIIYLEVVAGAFPAAPDLAPSIGGTRLEGTTVINSGVNSARLSFEFYNNIALWKRDINSYVTAGTTSSRDLGWRVVTADAGLEEMTTARVTAVGNSLATFLLCGEFTTSQPAMAQFTDNPYTAFGLGAQRSIIRNRRMYGTDHILQLVTSLFGGQEFQRDIVAGSPGTWRMNANSSVAFTSGNALNFGGGTVTASLNSSNVLPRTTNTYSIGSAVATYANGYFQNAITVVSDRNQKDFISAIPDEVLDVWDTVEYSQWKMKSAIELKGPDGARYHTGVVAQDVKEAFEAAGLDATVYGILIHETWEATPETSYVPAVYDEETDQLIKEAIPAQEAREAGEIWLVRMEECLAIEAALMRRTRKKLEERLAALESK